MSLFNSKQHQHSRWDCAETPAAMTQRDAYDKCVELAGKHGWQATLCELVEGGFDTKTNFIKLYKEWVAQEDSV